MGKKWYGSDWAYPSIGWKACEANGVGTGMGSLRQSESRSLPRDKEGDTPIHLWCGLWTCL